MAQYRASDAETSTNVISSDELKEVLKQLKAEEPPKTAEERETYFMSQVGLGEQLALQGTLSFESPEVCSVTSPTGPTFYLPAAMAFFRALRVYPSPVELIVIYQKTIPEPVFKVIQLSTCSYFICSDTVIHRLLWI